MEALLRDKTVLCDSHFTKNSKTGLRLLTESNDIQKYKGNPNALGVLYGPCADFTVATANNHFYSKRLWELVINSDYVKEAIKTKTLFGEIDHPEERLELKAEYAAINCTNLWVDEAEQCLMGCFDILPTDKGKIVKSLCDYGSVLGVSSRGIGDLTYEPDIGNVVNEDSYLFVCFDVVVQPASRNARQNYKSLTEQEKLDNTKSVIQVLKEGISNCSSESEIDQINSIIDKFGFSNDSELTGLLQEKRKVLKNNTNVSIIKMNKTLKEDLEQAYERIRNLESKNDSNSIMAEISFLRSQIGLIREAVSQPKDKDVIGKELKRLNKLLKDQESKEKTELQEQANLNESLTKRIEELQNSLSEEKRKNKKLQETVDYAVSFVDKCKTSYKTLREAFNSSKSKNDNLATKLKQTQERLDEANGVIANAKTKIEGSNRLSKALREEYIGQQEVIYGRTFTMTRSKVNEAKSLKDIDLLISQETSTITNKRPSIASAITESDKPKQPGEISVIREALRANRKS